MSEKERPPVEFTIRKPGSDGVVDFSDIPEPTNYKEPQQIATRHTLDGDAYTVKTMRQMLNEGAFDAIREKNPIIRSTEIEVPDPDTIEVSRDGGFKIKLGLFKLDTTSDFFHLKIGKFEFAASADKIGVRTPLGGLDKPLRVRPHNTSGVTGSTTVWANQHPLWGEYEEAKQMQKRYQEGKLTELDKKKIEQFERNKQYSSLIETDITRVTQKDLDI